MVTRNACGAALAIAAMVLPPVRGTAQGILAQMQDEVASIVSRARPSIVSIEDERAFGGSRDRQKDNARSRPDGNHPSEPHPGPPDFQHRGPGGPPKIGSGFSIGDGYIVTTADVLSGMTNPIIQTEDGRRIRATVSGIDPELNIGVLKLTTATPVPGLTLGRSSGVYPGHFAISIGNQYGHMNSVALTLVAGVRDDGIQAGEHFYPGLIQIAGTVGVGTSGAPILNARGEVIGMIAGIPFGDWTSSPFPMGPPKPDHGSSARGGVINAASPQNSPRVEASGPVPPATAQEPRIIFMRPPVTSAGFALPIDDMRMALTNLRHGKLVHCWLGVDMREDRKREENDGIVTWKRWVTVSTVYPNSPASAAGLQTGDVITGVSGRKVLRLSTIRAALLRDQPGESMELQIERKGAVQAVSARLVQRPDQPLTSGPGKHQ